MKTSRELEIRAWGTTLSLTGVFVLLLAMGAAAQGGADLSHQKISDLEGGFTGGLLDLDGFGSSLAVLGDLDRDGVVDLAVGADHDKDGGTGFLPYRGAVWILFLNADGTVKSHQKISDTQGGFTGSLDDNDRFGCALAPVGDFDGDGTADLAVGAHLDDDGGFSHGAVWLLFLNGDGTVKDHQKISDSEGGFTGQLDYDDQFGCSLAFLGDLDGDGIGELAVGAPSDDDGGYDTGAVWILFLNEDGMVKAHQKISATEGAFVGDLDLTDYFGHALAGLEDFDGDGVAELAVGAINDADGGEPQGAVWILFLQSDGTVKSHQKISATQGGFIGHLEKLDRFGRSIAALDDLDGDGTRDLAVGAPSDDDGGLDCGALWLLYLASDGTVKTTDKISVTAGGFTGSVDPGDDFARSAASLGDLDGDGLCDVIVGAPRDDDGGEDRGAVWSLFLSAKEKLLPDVASYGGSAVPYGCGINPEGSVAVLSAVPTIGGKVVIGLDNPLGTQAKESATFLAIALDPDPAFPCGTPMPGFGMAGPGEPGEFLISLLPPNPIVVITGPPWGGPGMPASLVVQIPSDPEHIGTPFYAQGIIFDVTAPAGVVFGLTDAVEVVIGL